MSAYIWQKSSYSTEGANCVNIATASDGTLRMRESDDPDVILATTPTALSALLASVKEGGSRGVRP